MNGRWAMAEVGAKKVPNKQTKRQILATYLSLSGKKKAANRGLFFIQMMFKPMNQALLFSDIRRTNKLSLKVDVSVHSVFV